jgi:hypothetical protein
MVARYFLIYATANLLTLFLEGAFKLSHFLILIGTSDGNLTTSSFSSKHKSLWLLSNVS